MSLKYRIEKMCINKFSQRRSVAENGEFNEIH